MPAKAHFSAHVTQCPDAAPPRRNARHTTMPANDLPTTRAPAHWHRAHRRGRSNDTSLVRQAAAVAERRDATVMTESRAEPGSAKPTGSGDSDGDSDGGVDDHERPDVRHCTDSCRHNAGHDHGRGHNFLYHELPHWLRDNEHIRSRYRQPCLPKVDCAKSVVAVHNETANILTHGVAAAAFATMFVRRMVGLQAFGPLKDAVAALFGKVGPPNGLVEHMAPCRRGPHELSLVAWTACFGASAVAHTFSAHSEAACANLFRIDRSLIATGMSSITLASGLIHFRSPRARAAFAIAGILSGGAVVTAVSGTDAKMTGVRRHAILLGLCSQGLLALLPALRELALTGNPLIKGLVYRYAPLAIVYGLAGVVFFATKYPESKYPGKWDLFGSHSVMHVLTALSAYYAYKGCSKWSRHKNGVLRTVGVAKAAAAVAAAAASSV